MINPTTGMTARHWTAQTSLLISRYATIPILYDDSGWKAWAAYVCSIPALAAVSVPRPEIFKDWREWAISFNAQTRNLGL